MSYQLSTFPMWFLQYCNGSCLVEEEEDVSLSEKLPGSEASTVNTLRELWRPLVCRGEVTKHELLGTKLFKETTFNEVDLKDVIDTAKKIRSANINEQDCYRIDECLLTKSVLEYVSKEVDVSSLYFNQMINWRIKALVVYTSECRDRVCIDPSKSVEDRVGMIEVMLHSAYTGGELQVMCDGQVTDMKTAPYDWVAVHADASCSISPVTSGARVSLVFDIVAITKRAEIPLYVGESIEVDKHNDKLYNGLNISAGKDVDTLTSLAKRLRPEFKNQNTVTIDACLLNAATLKEMPQSANLRGLFFNKKLDFRPKYLAICDGSTRNESTSALIRDRKLEEGYLGELVFILKYGFYIGGEVHFSRAGSQPTVLNAKRYWEMWYAYAAGTTHCMKPIHGGRRVTLHYDIYEVKQAFSVQDPLGNAFVHTQTLPELTRSAASAKLTALILAKVKSELSEADAVIITLQYLYPDNVQPETLLGGDRALYNILTTPVSSSVDYTVLYDVQFVNVTLQYHYDAAQDRNILVRSTFSYCAGNVCEAPVSTRFIVPTCLTSEHHAPGNSDVLGPYYVKGIRVSKR